MIINIDGEMLTAGDHMNSPLATNLNTNNQNSPIDVTDNETPIQRSTPKDFLKVKEQCKKIKAQFIGLPIGASSGSHSLI